MAWDEWDAARVRGDAVHKMNHSTLSQIASSTLPSPLKSLVSPLIFILGFLFCFGDLAKLLFGD